MILWREAPPEKREYVLDLLRRDASVAHTIAKRSHTPAAVAFHLAEEETLRAALRVLEGVEPAT